MKELSQKLKDQLVAKLLRNPRELDEPYLVRRSQSYTRRELAAEIQSESTIGIEILISMIELTIDLISRNRIN